MKLLVTGASGLLGRGLVERLRNTGHEVQSASRRAVDGSKDHYAVDLTDAAEAMSVVGSVAPSTIVHLAGGVRGTRHELYADNILTTVNVVSAAGRLSEKPHVVVVGSAAEYGEGVGEALDETAPMLPVNDYGRAKVAATTLAEVLGERLGVPLAIARPFNVVSNRLPLTTALGSLRHQLMTQVGPLRSIRCGRLDVVRDFVPLDFVIEALTRLAIDRLTGHYNVCSGVGISLGSMLEAMAHQLGVELAIEPVPDLVTLPAADTVIGDARRLARLGLTIRPTAESLALVCLGDPPTADSRSQ